MPIAPLGREGSGARSGAELRDAHGHVHPTQLAALRLRELAALTERFSHDCRSGAPSVAQTAGGTEPHAVAQPARNGEQEGTDRQVVRVTVGVAAPNRTPAAAGRAAHDDASAGPALEDERIPSLAAERA